MKNDNPRETLPIISIMQAALPEPNKRLNGKQMKLDDAAQSSSAVVTDTNAESGSSREEQSIITQDNQPMESAQTETTTSDSNGTSNSLQQKDENLQESLPIQEQQELSMPSIDVDTPTLDIDDHAKAQPTSIIVEQQVPFNQTISQFTEQSEPIRKPQISVAPSIETTSNNQGSRVDDALNNEPSSHHSLNSLKFSAQLHKQINEARRLIPTQKTVERKLRPMNIARNLAFAEQNPPNLKDETGSLSTRSLPTQQKNNRQAPTLQVTKETVTPILTKILNPLQKSLSTTRDQYLLNEQQQGNHRQRAPVNENHSNVINDTLQTDKWVKEFLTPLLTPTNSNSDTVTDHEVISDHVTSADDAPIESTNNFYDTRITSGCSCANRSTAAQNSTNHQSHRKEFNSTQNLAGNESFSINLKQEVRQSPEENNTEVTASTSSSTQSQHSNGDANKPLKKKHKKWRFALPAEYNPNDTRWTLKYRTKLPGLVELTPQSGVYISPGDLIHCQQVSKDCKSLARRLLSQVFNRKALSVCLTTTERSQISDNVGSNIRPELDGHACSELLNFVINHGLQRGWNTDLQPILRTLDSKIKVMRFRYGSMIEC